MGSPWHKSQTCTKFSLGNIFIASNGQAEIQFSQAVQLSVLTMIAPVSLSVVNASKVQAEIHGVSMHRWQ
jgi:hypothetical protein